MYYEVKTKQSYKGLTFCELKKTQTHDSCYFLCDTLNCIYKLMFTGLKLEHFIDLQMCYADWNFQLYQFYIDVYS